MARVPPPIKAHAALSYKEPLSVRLGRYAIYSGTTIAVLAVLYTIAWFATSMMVRANLQDWFAARTAEGYIATHDDKQARISGFPFALTVRLHDVSFALPLDGARKRNWVWHGSQLELSTVVLPWTIRNLNVDLSARQSLRIDGNAYHGQADHFVVTFDWMSKGFPDTVSLNINDLNLRGEGANVTVDQVTLTAQRENSGDYIYDLNAQRLGLAYGLPGMGKYLGEVIARGRVTHDFATEILSAQNVAAWRDRGGTLEVERLLIDYPPLSLQGNGTLALDGDLQIVGAFSARIQGFFETVERLRRARVIRGPDASMAKVVLGMLAKHPGNGGPATISLPLTVQDRALFAGPVRLIEIPQLKW